LSVLPFPATHLSILERLRGGDPQERRAAFGDLAAGYWRPSYHYLRLQWHLAPEAAEDAVQAFFTVAFEKGYLEKYDPSKARFRTFLRVCLDRFVQKSQKAEATQRRGGLTERLPLDFPGAERELAERAAADLNDPDRFFRDETIRALFGRALESLRRACDTDGKPLVFRVFERHDVRPEDDTSYASVARELGLTIAQVTNYLHVARRRFRELILTHLRDLVADDQEFRAEARDLLGLDPRASSASEARARAKPPAEENTP
jgi:RNA polymerase sigma factor (sigma-70 family)